MTPDLVIVFTVFITLSTLTVLVKSRRDISMSRVKNEWLLDSFNLLVQGLLVPILQILLISKIFQTLMPDLSGTLKLGMIGSFLLHFLVIDYAYYWNHRMLHSELFWKFHRIHHSARFLDVWVTSRNSLVSVFLLVYLWAQGLAVFLLAEPKYFLIACALSASLDLWRHSQFNPPWWLGKLLGVFLILPSDHLWHHSRTHNNNNYGANFKIWDKLHGTYLKSNEIPQEIGNPVYASILTQFLFPWRIK